MKTEKQKANWRRWYEKHRERILAECKARNAAKVRTDADRAREREKYAANRDQICARTKANKAARNARMTIEQRAEANEKHRAYYAANRDHLKAMRLANQAVWRPKNKLYVEKNRASVYESHTAFRFKITRAEVRALREEHPLCALCGGDNKGRPLVIDHDHETGRIRGMLCSCCNWGLGHFRDSPALLYKAAMYLAQHKTIGEVG